MQIETEKFYVICESRTVNSVGFSETAQGQTNGYKLYKNRINALKRLRSAAMTERGTIFYLMEVAAAATSPEDVHVEEY